MALGFRKIRNVGVTRKALFSLSILAIVGSSAANGKTVINSPGSYHSYRHSSRKQHQDPKQQKRKLPKTYSPTAVPTSTPSISSSARPSISAAPTTSPPTVIPSISPSILPEIEETESPTENDSKANKAIIPLLPFSLGLVFPPSTSANDIDYDLLADITESFLSDYISFRWSEVPPITSTSSNSDNINTIRDDENGIILNEKESKLFELYQYESIQLEITDTSSNPERRRRRQRQRQRYLQSNNDNNLEQPQQQTNQVISTWFEGDSTIRIPQEQFQNPPTFIEEERILLSVQTKVHQLQQEALQDHANSLLALVQTNTIGEFKGLSSVMSLLSLLESQPMKEIGGGAVASDGNDEVSEEDGQNDDVEMPTEDLNSQDNELSSSTNNNNNNNINNTSKSDKTIIIMALITGILGAIVILGAFKIYRKRKQTKPSKMKTRRKQHFKGSSSGNITEENDDFSDALEIYEMKQKIKRYPGPIKAVKHKNRKSQVVEHYDDMSSIGMGTAVFQPNMVRHRSVDGDEISQISLDYSVEGQSIEARQIPKYARSDHSDDDTTFHEAKFFALETDSRSSQQEQQRQQQQQQQTQEPPQYQHSPSQSNLESSYNQEFSKQNQISSDQSVTDTDSVWTFARMGNEDTLEEGIEVESFLMKSPEEDESIFGFTKFTAADGDDHSDSFSHVTGGSKSFVSTSSKGSPMNSRRKRMNWFSSFKENSFEDNHSMASFERGPVDWKKANTVTDFFAPNFFTPSEVFNPKDSHNKNENTSHQMQHQQQQQQQQHQPRQPTRQQSQQQQQSRPNPQNPPSNNNNHRNTNSNRGNGFSHDYYQEYNHKKRLPSIKDTADDNSDAPSDEHTLNHEPNLEDNDGASIMDDLKALRNVLHARKEEYKETSRSRSRSRRRWL